MEWYAMSTMRGPHTGSDRDPINLLPTCGGGGGGGMRTPCGGRTTRREEAYSTSEMSASSALLLEVQAARVRSRDPVTIARASRSGS